MTDDYRCDIIITWLFKHCRKERLKINNKRKNFNTTIDLDLQTKFKVKCIEKNIQMNDLLETFMYAFLEDKIDFEKSETFTVTIKK